MAANPIHRLRIALAVGVLCVAPATTMRAQALAPAPWRAVPPGATFDYGRWSCTVKAAAPFVHVCAGPSGEVAQFYAKLVPVNRLPAKGYGTGFRYYYCDSLQTFERQSYVVTIEVERVTLGDADRRALQGLWPLAVGKSATFERRLRQFDDKAKSTIRVTGTRTATVAGKTYPVYVLEGTTTGAACYDSDALSPQLLTFDERWWYAPDLGVVVHYEVKWRDVPQWGQSFSYDLKSFKLPAAAPRQPPPQVSERAPAPPAPPRTPKYAPPPRPRPPAPPPHPEAPANAAPALDRDPPVIAAPSSIRAGGAVVLVRGRVGDRSRVIEFTINGAPVPLDADGSFAVRRGVPFGVSTIVLGAVDEWGNRAERRIRVTRAAAQPPTVEAVATPRVPRAAGATGAATPAAPAPARQAASLGDPFAGVRFGAYYALVIGNNRYRYLNHLITARQDAQAVARLLKADYGFEVETLLDATRSQVLGALARLRATLGSDTNLLIYYAGHGVIDDVTRQGYWLPVDAEDRNPANWISNSDLTDMLRGMQARHVLVVADSCYSGTLVRAASARMATARDDVEWVRRMLRKRTRTALVSGGLEPVADGGGGGHSVFAKAFLDALRNARTVLEGQALFDAIKRPVVLNADQTPQYADIRRAGHEGGEFIFHRIRYN